LLGNYQDIEEAVSITVLMSHAEDRVKGKGSLEAVVYEWALRVKHTCALAKFGTSQSRI
jgi:hypothetical protein